MRYQIKNDMDLIWTVSTTVNSNLCHYLLRLTLAALHLFVPITPKLHSSYCAAPSTQPPPCWLSSYDNHRSYRLLEIVWPALLLRPLIVVRLGMDLELLEVGIDDLLAAIRALE